MSDEELDRLELLAAYGAAMFLLEHVPALIAEVRRLRTLNEGLVERVAGQSEVLSRMAERPEKPA